MTRYGVFLLATALSALARPEAAAQRRVTGRVLGAASEPLASATVNVQGTTIGAFTAENGAFVLNNVPSGPQVLVVRRLGYRRVTTSLAETQNEVEVRMERDVLELERQVITGTTTSVSSSVAPNAVSSVSDAELNRAPTPTLENAIQAKIPGAVVTQNSGAPGGGLQVQMRGVTSINAASSPLYVVDGVLVSNSAILSGLNSITNAGGGITASQDQPVNRIADLNPADIENIEVLKGASAGAIYGSKASNGVIIITTRRGTTGRPSLNVTQRIGTFQISKKLGLRCFHSAQEAQSWWTDVIGGSTLPAPWQPTCHDFEKEFYTPDGPSYETLLSVRGGSSGTTYYLGGLAKRDNAIQRRTYYQKQSVTANLAQVIGQRLNVRSNNDFIHSLTDRGIHGNDNSPVVSPGDVFSITPTFFDLEGKPNGQYQPNPFLAEKTNPFQDADLIKNPEDVYRYIGSVHANYSVWSTPRQTLDLSLLGGVDAFQYNSRLFSPPDVFVEAADGLPGTVVTNKTSSVFANLNLSGQHKFISDLATATTSFGLRQERRQNDVIVNQGKNLPAGVNNVDFAVQQALDESQFLVKDLAYYVQEELLTLHERLFLTAALNAERSSVNGDPRKFFSYPKFAASYRMPYLPPYADEIKLRVAYGKAGNQPPYGFAFTALPTGIYSGVLGARTSTVAGSPNIKPETSAETEGGIDAQFLRGRVALDVTAFRKVVTDLILQAQVAPSSGFTTKYINGGELQNTGTEFGISLTPIQRRDLSWVSRTTYAKVSGRINQLDVPCFNGGSFFSLRFGAPYVCKGYSPTTLQVNNGCTITPLPTSCPASARTVFAFMESAPSFTMGFSNDFTYGAFRLSGLLDWRKGGKAVNLTNAYYDPVLMRADTIASIRRWNRFLQGFASFVEDAGFVKLRELTLSYSIPTRFTQRFFSSTTRDVRLELSGRNLKTWTKYTGYDPEVSNFSNQNIGRFQDVTPYPASRSFFFSVSANF